MRKLCALAFALAMFVSLALLAAAQALPATGVKTAMDRTTSFLLKQEKSQGRQLSPWSYIAIAGAGRDLSDTMALQSCERQFAGLDSNELNNYSVLVLTILSTGGNPCDYQGQNLVEKIRQAQLPNGKFADSIDGGGLGSRGEQVLVNAHVWAILALHASGAGAKDPLKAKQWLVDRQLDSGGFNWNLMDNKADVDSTGMALMALGALGEKKDSPTVEKAVAYLKSIQEADGGFSSWGVSNPESCRMVISGLIAVGIDPDGGDFTRPGGNPVKAILRFQKPDGSFERSKGAGSNAMSTEQALLALADLYHGKTLFDRLREKNPVPGSLPKTQQPQRAALFKLGETKYEVSSEGRKQMWEADAAPFLENGRAFVPVRYLALALGVPEGGIVWSPAAQTVTLKHEGVTINLAVGKNVQLVNNREVIMDVAPLLMPPGRLYLPARYVSEALGFNVGWDERAKTVVISSK